MPPAKITLAVKLDSKVAQRVRRYCAERGLKQGFFVQHALLNEDLLDFKKHKAGEKAAVSFEDTLRLRHA